MNNHTPPLIVISLMIKNEAVSIQATLASYITKGINHFFILDTGSTDNTIELTQTFFEQNQLVGIIEQEPFIDFSTSRNRTLALTRQHFPEATFILMPYAEWFLQNPQDLLSFCYQEKYLDTPIYLIKIKMNNTEFTTARLFRANYPHRFKGVVHEAPEALAHIKPPDTVYFEVKSSQQGAEKSKRRWEQDLILLTDAQNENDQDPRTAFYLAQTYECLNLIEKAYQHYEHRSTLNGWDEENFITFYRLGYLAENLSQQYAYSLITWDTAMNHYLKAFSLRPHRIEPLIKIADHFWPDNIPTCFLFAKHAYDLPYPKNDLLFIEHHMYQYDRYEIISRCAWYMNEFVLGEKATRQALEIAPETPHLLQNLAIYQHKLAEISAQYDNGSKNHA